MKVVPIDKKVNSRDANLAMGVAAFHVLQGLIPFLEEKKVLPRTELRKIGNIPIRIYEHLLADSESASDKRLFRKIVSSIKTLTDAK
jgi:hypothetical protein